MSGGIRLDVIGGPQGQAQLKGVANGVLDIAKAQERLERSFHAGKGRGQQQMTFRQQAAQSFRAAGGVGPAGSMIGGALSLGPIGAAITAISLVGKRFFDFDKQLLDAQQGIIDNLRTFKASLSDFKGGTAKSAYASMSAEERNAEISKGGPLAKVLTEAAGIEKETDETRKREIVASLIPTLKAELEKVSNPERAIAAATLKKQEQDWMDLRERGKHQNGAVAALKDTAHILTFGAVNASDEVMANKAFWELDKSATAINEAAQNLKRATGGAGY